MVELLLEGLASAWLPCSSILLVPGGAAILAGGSRPLVALGGFAGSSLVTAWARFAERGGDWPVGISAVALIVGAVTLLASVVERARPDRSPAVDRLRTAAGGAMVGVAAAELWEPCVGAAFGSLLNDLPDRGVDGLFLLLAYGAGVLAPLLALGAASTLLPERLRERARPAVAVVGGAVLATMALATAAGLHDEVVARLIRWSL